MLTCSKSLNNLLPYLHVFLAQEGDEICDQAQGLLVEAFVCQVTDESLDGFRADFAQSEI